MTADLDAYSRQVTHLLGYFLKPAIDVTYLAFVMANRIGGRSLALFLAYFYWHGNFDIIPDHFSRIF